MLQTSSATRLTLSVFLHRNPGGLLSNTNISQLLRSKIKLSASTSTCACKQNHNYPGIPFQTYHRIPIQQFSTTRPSFKKRKALAQSLPVKEKPIPQELLVWKNITVTDLAKVLNRPIDDVFEMMLFIPNTNPYDRPLSEIDDVQVTREIVKKFGFRPKIITDPKKEKHHDSQGHKHEREKDITSMPVRTLDLGPRPPVVTIMGHVDHGKTTLLDTLRHSQVASMEAGGITQAIGAFQVQVKTDETVNIVTFIDTPGHAAFSSMRSRGSQSTDIVILVVAADDGVMEQTRESINMAKESNVPIIVAINKIDRGDANIERTKNMLLQEGIQLEDFGGDVMSVPVSGLKGTNLDLLVEAILTEAELLSLRSETKGLVEGVVLESQVDHGRGKLCSGLIQRGKLHKGSILVAGYSWAKVRGIFDENGKALLNAGPSTPVQIIGWRDLPSAGDKIFEVESERRAKEIVEHRLSEKMTQKQEEDSVKIHEKEKEWETEYKKKLEYKKQMGWYRLRREGPREKEIQDDPNGIPQLHILIKGDTDGSVESLLDVIETYDCENECRLDVVHYGVGDITENDVKLAEAFKAKIYGFNVQMPERIEKQCVKLNLEFRQSKIIYRLVEALKKDLESKLPPKDVEEVIGEANVLEVFMVTEGKKKIPVSGSRCIKGALRKDGRFKLVRGDGEFVTTLFDGAVHSMRHLKNEVTSIQKDVECGVCLEDFEVIPKVGDKIVCYKVGKVPQKTGWEPIGF